MNDRPALRNQDHKIPFTNPNPYTANSNYKKYASGKQTKLKNVLS